MTETDPPLKQPLTETEQFMLNVGVPMHSIFFIMADGRMAEENHVDDPLTLAETIAMSMDRTGAIWAVYPDGDPPLPEPGGRRDGGDPPWQAVTGCHSRTTPAASPCCSGTARR